MKTLKLIFAFVTLLLIVNCTALKDTTVLIKDLKLETIELDVMDSQIKDLLITHLTETKFKKGQSIKESTFRKERERIVKLIRANTNPDFPIEKVRFEIDTTLSKSNFSVKTIVLN